MELDKKPVNRKMSLQHREESARTEVSALPVIVWIVILSTAVALIAGHGPIKIAGKALSGYAWLVPLVFSIWAIMKYPRMITFPFKLWVPWISFVGLYLFISTFRFFYLYIPIPPNVLQRSIQPLAPIVIGIGVSTCRIHESHLNRFFTLCRQFAFVYLLIVAWRTGLLVTGIIPPATGLAGESMTATILCTLFAAYYVIDGGTKDLVLCGALLSSTVLAMVRGPIMATGLTFPLTFAPMKPRKRLLILLAFGVIGLLILYSPRMQQKMFWSGHGTLIDLKLDNPDLKTSGRFNVWGKLYKEVQEKPWFGHGTNAQGEFLLSWLNVYGQPHNDWLRLLFDYGLVGTLIFGGSLVVQSVHALRMARISTGGTRVLFYAGASAFLPFAVLMITDNIYLYPMFFGNLHFAFLGLAYAASMDSIPVQTD